MKNKSHFNNEAVSNSAVRQKKEWQNEYKIMAGGGNVENGAGIIAYRIKNGKLQVMLSHAGGPYFKRQSRQWGIQKGKIESGETPEDAARREFHEETGFVPLDRIKKLGIFKVSNTKRTHVYYMQADFDTEKAVSNFFEVEWPPHSGKIGLYPETDKAAWMGMVQARRRIFFGQVKILDALEKAVTLEKTGLCSECWKITLDA